MEHKIALIRGDGIGPEIVTEAKKVLDKVCEKYNHSFTYSESAVGRCIHRCTRRTSYGRSHCTGESL